MDHANRKLGGALALALLSLSAGAAPNARPYVVQLDDDATASYQGGIAGLAPTAAAPGQRLNLHAAAVQSYAAFLRRRQDAVITAAGVQKVLHRYTVVANGFSAVLTEAQAAKIRGMKGVRRVTPDQPRPLLTNYTPHFLGLDTPDVGLWSQWGHGKPDRGEDVIVGLIDTGIQPEESSFYDHVDKDGHWKAVGGIQKFGPPPASFTGGCDPAPGFHCNNKLVGARFYNASFNAFLESTGAHLDAAEYADSPRDSFGHGSHTASTAAGNWKADGPVGNGAQIGPISGMAPRARISMYKACWSYTQTLQKLNSCFDGDVIAGIEQAVSDGVDVLSFSIGGTLTDLVDPVETAFFNAAAAGVFVSAAAGNSGPGSTLNHPSPWLTTVAATTHDRLFFADGMLGDGSKHTGASLSDGLPSSPLILSTDAGLNGQNPEYVRLCYLGALDPAKVTGKIVVCDRGLNARVDKSQEVANKGGIGMYLLNTPADLPGGGSTTLNDDPHSVPTIHLQVDQRDAVRAYAANAGGTSSFGTRYKAPGIVAPQMASFSSRGPDLATPSVLKPDIGAPGVSVWATVAYVPPDQATHDAIANGTFSPPPVVGLLDGTSMATPHVSGTAALLRQKHPAWSVSEIKSALMTTAGSVYLPDGSIDPEIFGYGAGQLNPNPASEPGLVYPQRPTSYTSFLCGLGALPPDDPGCEKLHGGMVPTDLNLASLSGDVMGVLTFHRAVRNVGQAPATYTLASASVPGFNVAVSPSTLVLDKGGIGRYSVTVTLNGAAIDAWNEGSLTWSDGTHTVRSPIALRYRLLATPPALWETATDGNEAFMVQYGFDGATSVRQGGKTAKRTDASVKKETTGDGLTACQTQGEGTASFTFPVTSSALAARFATYDADTSGYKNGGSDDLDMYVFDSANNLLGSSAGATANEMVSLPSPKPDTYRACVVGFAPANGESQFTLSSWVVNDGEGASSFRIKGAPDQVQMGGHAKVHAKWQDIAKGTRYLGVAQFLQGTGDGALPVGATLVGIDTTDAPGLSVVGASHKRLRGR
jgi:subtilisin family serine protease